VLLFQSEAKTFSLHILKKLINPLNKSVIITRKSLGRVFLSKAARGRPEGPTERSVFKIIFVMLAIF